MPPYPSRCRRTSGTADHADLITSARQARRSQSSKAPDDFWDRPLDSAFRGGRSGFGSRKGKIAWQSTASGNK